MTDQTTAATERAVAQIYEILKQLEQIDGAAPFSAVIAIVGHISFGWPDPEDWFSTVMVGARNHREAILADAMHERVGQPIN